MILGIDPGVTGAYALLYGEAVLMIGDMPVRVKMHGKGKEIDPVRLKLIINEADRAAALQHKKLVIVIERVSNRPGEGTTSAFSFGRTVGVVDAIVELSGAPVHYILPARWKMGVGLRGKPKDASRTKALQLFPEARRHLDRKKDVDRAEALLLAYYYRTKEFVK